MKLPYGVETKVERTDWGWFLHSEVLIGTTLHLHARGTVCWYEVPFLWVAVVREAFRELHSQ